STSTLDLASVLLWVIVQSFHIVVPVLRAPSGPGHQGHVTFARLRGITWRLRTRYAPQATLASSVPYLCHRTQRRPWTGLSRPQIGLSLGIIFAIHRVGRTPTASISGRGIRAAPVGLPRAGVDIGGRRSRWHRPRPPGFGEDAGPRRPRSAAAESRRSTSEIRQAPVPVFVPPPGHV